MAIDDLAVDHLDRLQTREEPAAYLLLSDTTLNHRQQRTQSGRYEWTKEDVSRATRSRSLQGLPDRIVDPAVLSRVARLLTKERAD